MFFKLALRNVARSFRDYGVYLLTLTFGVCLFYTFNSVQGQGAMLYLEESQNEMVSTIMILIDIFSVVVAVVLAALILYANRFLLRRRKRELGTYLLLGLDQGQVARILFLETGVIGVVALVTGLILGVVASFGMSELTLSMFSLREESIALRFSFRAAGKTVLYFGIIFLLIMLLSGVEVSRAKLIDLIQGERRNEVLRVRSLRWTAVQFALGVVCIGVAYWILLFFGMAVAVVVLPLCVVMLGLGTLGTLLIFRSLSGFVLRFVQKRPRLYFRDLNLFTLRQWISRVHTTYLSQTVICILLLLAIGITASSIGLNSAIEQSTTLASPFDISIENRAADMDGPMDFEAALGQMGFDCATKLAWSETVPVYYNDPEITGDNAPAVLPLSGYNTLMERQGKEPYDGSLPYLPPDGAPSIIINGSLGMPFLVVDDETAERLSIRRQIWCADYAGDKEETELELKEIFRGEEWRDSHWGCYADTRLEMYQEQMGSKMIALFLGLYLGFTFLLAAAAVLALQQMSQAADNVVRYRVLRRLGAGEKMVSRSATQQVALAFLLPLGLALIHTFVGMKAANLIISSVGQVDATRSSAVTGLVLAAIYGGYFLATSLACRRIARNA